jgi:phage tail tape-measure protein
VNDPRQSSPKILSDRVGAVIGAVIGSRFGPIGAGVGALVGHTLGGIYGGISSETTSSQWGQNGQQDVRSEHAPSSSNTDRPDDKEVATCPHCGRKNVAGGLLCMYCGGRLPDAEEGDR